jgi:hypothetical protein
MDMPFDHLDAAKFTDGRRAVEAALAGKPLPPRVKP